MLRMEDFMIGSRVFVIKERDEWSNFAEFIGAMVAKYADKIDFESLPDPELYLLKRNCKKQAKPYIFRQLFSRAAKLLKRCFKRRCL